MGQFVHQDSLSHRLFLLAVAHPRQVNYFQHINVSVFFAAHFVNHAKRTLTQFLQRVKVLRLVVHNNYLLLVHQN